MSGPGHEKPPGNGGGVDRWASAQASVGRQGQTSPHPKRFYESAAAADCDGGYTVTLDGRPLKTPARTALVIPARALAAAMAAEWAAQGTHIDAAAMPLTRIANTALDAVALAREAVAADIVAFAGTDALCYRAQSPPGLIAREAARWDPVLAWAADTLGARLVVGQGIVHVAQPAEAMGAIATALAPLSHWQLAPLHVMTTLTGSAVLALAVGGGRLPAREAWDAAHVDDDWQIEHWGQDEEAAIRRAQRWSEMSAAATFLAIVRQG